MINDATGKPYKALIPGENHHMDIVEGPDGVWRGFAATVFDERARLGDRITEWLAANPRRTVTEIVVTQSSDCAYHCLTITVLFSEPG